MNTKISKKSIFIALISTLLIVVTVTGGLEPQGVTSQNATDLSTIMGGTGSQNQTQIGSQNQTQIGSQNQTQIGSQNQTQMALANLTRADLGPVTSALDSARDSILNYSSVDAYTFLSDADDALFKTAIVKGPSSTTTIVEKLVPVRNHIEAAQNMLIAGDLPIALNERNLAEVELLKILLGLTPGEEPTTEEEELPTEEEEEEEEEPEEEEPEEEE
jgi:hypothetical protein